MTHKLRCKIFTGFLSANKKCNPHLCCCSVTQSCLPLCDSVDCSAPDSSVHGISQPRTVEWVATSFSMGSFWLRDQTCIFCISRCFTTEPPRKANLCCCCCIASVVSDSVWPHRQQPTRFLCPWDTLGKNTGVGCHFLLQCMKVKSKSEAA